MKTRANGKPDTGAILHDLPSPYLPHPATGLLHLPRFLAKIGEAHRTEGLPKEYRRNYKRGFDGFLCMHLNVDPDDVEALVLACRHDEAERDRRLRELFPEDLRVAMWNRKLVQMGTRGMGREKLEEVKAGMGIAERDDLQSFADMIEFDEDRID